MQISLASKYLTFGVVIGKQDDDDAEYVVVGGDFDVVDQDNQEPEDRAFGFSPLGGS